MAMRSISPGSFQLKCITFLSLLVLSFIPLTAASLESTTFGVPRAHMEKRRAPNYARLIPEPLLTSSHTNIPLSSSTALPSSTAAATSSSPSASLPSSTSRLPTSSSAPASSSFTSSSSTPGFPVPTSLSSSTALPSLSSSSVASITIPVPSSASSASLSLSSLSSSSSPISVAVPLQLTSFSTSSTPLVITTVTASTSSSPRVVPVATGVSGNVSNDSKSGFFSNTGAVAGTFTVVGVVALALLITLIYCCKKRRQSDEDDYDTYFEKVSPNPNPAATIPAPAPAQNMFAPAIYPDPPSNPFVEEAYIQDAYVGQSNAYAGPSHAPGQQQQYNDYHLEQPDMYQPESAYQPPQAQYPTARPARPTSGGGLTTQEHLAALQPRRRSSRGPPQPEINPFGTHAVVHDPNPYGGDTDSFYGGV